MEEGPLLLERPRPPVEAGPLHSAWAALEQPLITLKLVAELETGSPLYGARPPLRFGLTASTIQRLKVGAIIPT